MVKRKILAILGPTGIGKTSLGLRLAEKFGGDILVADSRQVYKGMDVVTGKDIPKNGKWQIQTPQRAVANDKLGCWLLQNGTRIWLTDIVQPIDEFSVSHWNKYAKQAIEQVSLNNKLPILTVGTGLYLKSLTGNIETINIPQDLELRKSLENKDVEELFTLLTESDLVKAKSMNNSDRKNKRRLIRAIEVAKNFEIKKPTVGKTEDFNFFKVGLTSPKEIVFERIDKRVDARLKAGALDETKKLLSNYSDWSGQAFLGVGYRYLREYLLGKKKLDLVVEEWKEAEHAYAKRQMTWFKKEPVVNWFEITDSNWEEKV
ncbi:MAG: tRNA (adenosine(37)-N6)-dimethylallyltransferase MiaA, partial [bacterium]|nr:tRNA (adenosine(37)-N6)-dimethylallyltransferase MiaA [bacterium]